MSILSVLVGVGMTPSLPKLVQAGPPKVLSVLLDGRVVGSIPSDLVEKAVTHMRRLKLSATAQVCSVALCFKISFLNQYLSSMEILDS